MMHLKASGMMNRKTVFVVKMVIVHLGSMYLHVGRDALLFFFVFFYDAHIRKKTQAFY